MNNLFNKKFIDQRYGELLKNKRVALIGPSRSGLLRENGEYIDQFDLVVRINWTAALTKKFKKFVGSKTDIMYSHECHSTSTKVLFKKSNVKYLCSASPGASPIDIVDVPVNFEWYKHLSKEIAEEPAWHHRRPSTGFYALIHLLLHNVSKLYIKGFDFYVTHYAQDYQQFLNPSSRKEVDELTQGAVPKKCGHDQKKQWKFFKSLFINYPSMASKIELDPFLNKLLNIPFEDWEDRFEILKDEIARSNHINKTL